MAKRSEYRHVVPGHPPFGDLSVLDTEYCPKIKLCFAPRRREWAYRSLLRAFIGGPCSDEVSFRDQKLDRLDRIGKNRRVLPQKFFDLLKAPRLDTWRC